MCGIAGVFTSAPAADAVAPEAVSRMTERMRPRGPDGEGQWQEHGVALGHRRLAIIDLDARAAQPMHSACGRYVVVFNGEIYNFRDLRRDMEGKGVAFSTTSDTEVLLALFAAEGEAMLPKLHGMFAFVIWDCKERRALAARDPFGIKPLYLAETADGVLVASQVKALLASGLVSRAPCAKGRAGFWMLGSVPEPHTWYRDIRALPAGHCAWIEAGRVRQERQWHDIGKAWREAGSQGTLPDGDVQSAVRHALRESVQRHLVSDVPVGVFLSGGIDSGSLAGLMAELGTGPIEGVTLAYDEFAGHADDEAPAAAVLANHYGLRHTIRRVTREEFLADLPRILEAMDQPSIDGVNTWYASKAVAERGLKVVVSGVGGDELFQGYSHFRSLPRLLAVRRAAAWLPGAAALIDRAGRWQAARTGNARWRHLEQWTRSIEGAWWLRRSVCAPEQLPALIGADRAREALADFDVVGQVRAMTGELPRDPALALGQIESATYLRNQLLRDSDWASMDHSVELRTPLVDAHLLQQLQGLLPEFYRFPGKRLLASAPGKPLPQALIRRRKTGFGIPVPRWLASRQQRPSSWQAEIAGAFS
jgi:asparagine synthase (glutamine-hydrolysing)